MEVAGVMVVVIEVVAMATEGRSKLGSGAEFRSYRRVYTSRMRRSNHIPDTRRNRSQICPRMTRWPLHPHRCAGVVEDQVGEAWETVGAMSVKVGVTAEVAQVAWVGLGTERAVADLVGRGKLEEEVLAAWEAPVMERAVDGLADKPEEQVEAMEREALVVAREVKVARMAAARGTAMAVVEKEMEKVVVKKVAEKGTLARSTQDS